MKRKIMFCFTKICFLEFERQVINSRCFLRSFEYHEYILTLPDKSKKLDININMNNTFVKPTANETYINIDNDDKGLFKRCKLCMVQILCVIISFHSHTSCGRLLR